MDLPAEHVVEVSLIGTGGGYGESSVIHVGNNEWIVIDSCVNPNTFECLPLEYLKKIGVDVKTQVKSIVCTHWHNDHIQGMSQLVREAESAIFCSASCTDVSKFMHFIGLDSGKEFDNSVSSSTTEFKNCLAILDEREQTIRRAVVDRTLFSSNTSSAIMYSLSPSDYTLTQFDLEISTLTKLAAQRNKKIVIKSPNAKSVVIYLKIGKHTVLLGADLEVSSNENEGWHNILLRSEVTDSKASLFKIPHHGSHNGFLVDVWKELLHENPVGKMTPWNRGATLPQLEMINLYATYSEMLYITADTTTLGRKAKARERTLERLIMEQNNTVREVKYKDGLIRSRINMHEQNAAWDVVTFGEAIHINKHLARLNKV